VSRGLDLSARPVARPRRTICFPLVSPWQRGDKLRIMALCSGRWWDRLLAAIVLVLRAGRGSSKSAQFRCGVAEGCARRWRPFGTLQAVTVGSPAQGLDGRGHIERFFWAFASRRWRTPRRTASPPWRWQDAAFQAGEAPVPHTPAASAAPDTQSTRRDTEGWSDHLPRVFAGGRLE
jgi:hypothetical protein